MSNDTNRLAANQTIAYDATTTTSTPFAVGIYQARIVATTLSHYKIGAAGLSATVADPMLPANWPEYVTVAPGQYVAFIKTSGGTAGIATITDCT